MISQQHRMPVYVVQIKRYLVERRSICTPIIMFTTRYCFSFLRNDIFFESKIFNSVSQTPMFSVYTSECTYSLYLLDIANTYLHNRTQTRHDVTRREVLVSGENSFCQYFFLHNIQHSNTR